MPIPPQPPLIMEASIKLSTAIYINPEIIRTKTETVNTLLPKAKKRFPNRSMIGEPKKKNILFALIPIMRNKKDMIISTVPKNAVESPWFSSSGKSMEGFPDSLGSA